MLLKASWGQIGEEGKYDGQSERKLYQSKDLGSDSGELLKTKKVAQTTKIWRSRKSGPNQSANARRIEEELLVRVDRV